MPDWGLPIGENKLLKFYSFITALDLLVLPSGSWYYCDVCLSNSDSVDGTLEISNIFWMLLLPN